MTMIDLIAKKRDGAVLSEQEIAWFIDGYTKGEIPDYQMSAMLMAIYFNGMTDDETLALTMSMVNSGDVIDLSSIEGQKADKHSTGGVGDKTSLILCPMLAAQGVKMAKLSGRGLGHTGGTIDKLESFEGLSTSMSMEQFLKNVNEVGFAIAGQTAEIVPADKKLYALRDVTATVPSRPLIVSSIMSKKLASGADVIVLDVKLGSGAFMKTEADAFKLAEDMVRVGNGAGKRVAAVVTDMDQPLGYAIGNALEVKEAISVLNGETGGDLLELCLVLGANIMLLSGAADSEEEAKEKLETSIKDGSALKKLAEFIEAQGGNPESVYNPSLLPNAKILFEVRSEVEGYVSAIEAEQVGLVSLHLGGGRETKDSVIDLAVGVVLNKKVGDFVKSGETLAVIHGSNDKKVREAAALLRNSYCILNANSEKSPFIRGVVR